jgi:hypothetical protein
MQWPNLMLKKYFLYLFSFTKNVSTTHSTNGNMPIPHIHISSLRLLLVQEVQSQFPAVTSLLFPEHISSQKAQPTNKMNQKYCTRVVPPVVPACAKIIDRRRSLSPVKNKMSQMKGH